MATEKADAAIDWPGNVARLFTEEEKKNEEEAAKGRIQFYSEHADSYDADMAKARFRAPDVAAQALHQQLDGNFGACILDVGCGTGRVAEMLLQLGPYTNMVGLDPSQGMVDIAENKNIYKETKCQYMHLDCGLEHDTYDAVVTSGTILPGHMKANCLIEFCRITKSGGYIVITMTTAHEGSDIKIGDVINKLTSEKKLKVVKDESFPGYISYDAFQQGQLYVFQKL